MVKQILIMEYAFEKISHAISHLKNTSRGKQSQTGTATFVRNVSKIVEKTKVWISVLVCLLAAILIMNEDKERQEQIPLNHNGCITAFVLTGSSLAYWPCLLVERDNSNPCWPQMVNHNVCEWEWKNLVLLIGISAYTMG